MKKLPKLLTQAVLTTVILNSCTKENIVQPDNHGVATVSVNSSMQSSDTTSTESLKKKVTRNKISQKEKVIP
jgi:hypothetical protein